MPISAPEQMADLVADMGVEVWALGRCELNDGALWPSDMLPRSKQLPNDRLARGDAARGP